MPRMQSEQNRYSTVSAKISGSRLERFEAHAETTGKSKSAILREGIDQVVGAGTDSDNGRAPPVEDDLATAYEALLRMSNGGGWVRQDQAKQHLAQRVTDYNKETVYGGLLKPLADRGYIRLASDSKGLSSAVYVHE